MDALLHHRNGGHGPSVVENMREIREASFHRNNDRAPSRWSQKSHLVLHRGTRMMLAFDPSFRQIHRVRWLAPLLVLLFAARANAASPASNPAFLGIEMTDSGVGCIVNSVTNCSPAQDAGLRFGD